MIKEAYIYKITNKVNNYAYIGITQDRSAVSRWAEHIHSSNALSEAINIYGIENFTFEVIERLMNLSSEELRNREQYFINRFHTIAKGYNRINSVQQKRELSSGSIPKTAEKGLRAFQELTYVGNNESKTSGGFWSKLEDENSNMIKLIMGETLFNKPTSKYWETLWFLFSLREQSCLHIQISGEDYAITSMEGMREFVNFIRANRIEVYEARDYTEYSVLYFTKTIRIKVYCVLNFSDEVRYYNQIKSIQEINLGG